jgi:hypothetical protein
MTDTIDLYARLRAETLLLLGFDLNRMTAAQITRLDRVTTLRMLADGMQTAAVRGETISIAQFTEVMSELEKLLGGDPQQARARDFTGARIKLENMLDRLIAERKRKESETGRCTHCGALLVQPDASENASEKQQATPLDRLNLLRVAAGAAPEDEPEATAAPDQEAAAAALAAAPSPPSWPSRLSPPPPPQSPSPPPPQPVLSDVERMAKANAVPVPRHYLQNYDEPWRPFSYMFMQ